MCVNLPQGLYLRATQKKKREGHTRGDQEKTVRDQNGSGNKGQRTLTNANALAHSNPLPPQVSHTLNLTLYKGVALCRSAPC